MNKRTFVALAIAFVTIVPTIATAALIVNQEVSVNASHANNRIYFTPGSDYRIANELGFMDIVNGSGSNNVSLTLKSIHGFGYVIISDALDIVNNTSVNFTVYSSMNGSLPKGVVMFYYLTQDSYNHNDRNLAIYRDAGNYPMLERRGLNFQFLSFGQEIHIESSGVAVHIGFIIPGFSSGNGFIELNAKISM